VAGVAIYLVLPSITEVLAQWPRLSTLHPVWLTLAVAAELAHFYCTFSLQRLALKTRGWFAVTTAQLAGNAVTNIVPGGAAAGAAVQYKMLATSGIDSGVAVGGLTAFSLLGVAGLLALPIFALPAILVGVPVSGGLLHAAFVGIGGFVLFAAFGAALLTTNRPLLVTGRIVQKVRNWILRRRPATTDLDVRLLAQRDAIRDVLGAQWQRAVLLSAGRLAFDYLCLIFALRAAGSHPHASLVLLAYAAAGIVGMIPITPGGLGIVEASLSGLLVLAGVDASKAFLATLAYRLASYWLPLLVGPVAYALYRRRFGAPRQGPAVAPASLLPTGIRLRRGGGAEDEADELAGHPHAVAVDLGHRDAAPRPDGDECRLFLVAPEDRLDPHLRQPHPPGELGGLVVELLERAPHLAPGHEALLPRVRRPAGLEAGQRGRQPGAHLVGAIGLRPHDRDVRPVLGPVDRTERRLQRLRP
jgi:uncharacterized protein (TIRG00374 family)